MRAYDQAALKARLEHLNEDQRVAFAAACASRILPAYDDYHKSGQGEPETLRRVLESVWSWIQGTRKERASYVADVEALTTLLPGEDEGNAEPGRWAVDALSSAIYTVEALIYSDPQRAVWAAEQVVDAVEDFVRSAWFSKHGEVPSAQEEVSDPLMQTLLGQYERDLSDLEKLRPGQLVAEALRFRRRAEAERALPAA
jgi:uncharacterized protein YjaG (DUF416 family)